MTALVMYDSMYGNTEKIARIVAEVLGGEARRANELAGSDVAGRRIP
jgi:flavodoxin